MMEDPVLLSVVATADRLGMLPSQVREQATHWDFVQLAALDKFRDKDWRTEQDRLMQIERSKKMTGKQKFGALAAGLRGEK